MVCQPWQKTSSRRKLVCEILYTILASVEALANDRVYIVNNKRLNLRMPQGACLTIVSFAKAQEAIALTWKENDRCAGYLRVKGTIVKDKRVRTNSRLPYFPFRATETQKSEQKISVPRS